MTTANELYEAAKALVDFWNDQVKWNSAQFSMAKYTLECAVSAYQPLRWTTEPPTVEGWYWYQDDKGSYMSGPRIVELKNIGGMLCSFAWGLNAIPVSDNPIPGVEWSGPIQLPEWEHLRKIGRYRYI